MSYEEDLKLLEDIIYKLENENQSLDESIRLYEKASEIIKVNYEKIKDGKGKIVKINEKLEEIDFDVD